LNQLVQFLVNVLSNCDYVYLYIEYKEMK
jgi:hypothetical protein